MSIIRINKREHPYAQVDKRVLEDKRLSWRAKGILVYLLTKPDGWTVKVADIWGKGQEGRGAVQSCLKELNRHGYAQLVTIKGEGSTFAGKEWQVNEEPIGGFQVATDKPKTDLPTYRDLVGRAVNSNNESLSEINRNNEGESGDEKSPPAPTQNHSTLKAKTESEEVAPPTPLDEWQKETSDWLEAQNAPSKKVAPKKDPPGEPAFEMEICKDCGGDGYDPYPNHSTTMAFCQTCLGNGFILTNTTTHIVTETTNDPNIKMVAGVNVSEPVTKTVHFPQTTPGTTIVEAIPPIQPTRKNGRIEIPDEAAAEILPWANGDGAETVKGWYSLAFRQHSPKDVEAMVMRFSTVFLSSEKAAYRDMMETNPLSFFKRRFSGFIIDQKQHDRNNASKDGGATRGQVQQPPSALPVSLQRLVGK